MTPDKLGHDEAESGQLRDVAPPGVGRREKQPSSLTNRGRDRESERDRAYNQSGAGSRTPPSEYQLAPMALPPHSKDSRARQLTPSPERRRPIKPDKHHGSRFMIKPPRFEGKDSCLESHLVQFEIVAKRNGWDEFEKADFLKCFSSGEASHLLRDLIDSATYDDVVYKLRQRYGSLEQIESFRMELKQRKRKAGESLSSLLKDVRRLFAQAFPGPPNYFIRIDGPRCVYQSTERSRTYDKGPRKRTYNVGPSVQSRRTFGTLSKDPWRARDRIEGEAYCESSIRCRRRWLCIKIHCRDAEANAEAVICAHRDIV